MKTTLSMLLVLGLGWCAAAGDDLRVLPAMFDGAPASEMMHRYLLSVADQHFAQWKAEYEKRLAPDQVAEYQKQRRDFFINSIGGFPERTPLNANITGVVKRDGFTVEKIVFESQPRHYVTAAMFLPDASRFKAPYPGVLVVCGHSANGKGEKAYQSACALLALNGIAALIVDPIFQGERYQLVDSSGKLLINSSTTGHTLVAVSSIPLGRNTARFEIWDGMRAIDYLQSRDDIDPKRIGCMGNSGGGTQTAYLMALDERIQAASPSCYITSFERLLNTLGPQDGEQNIFGQIKHGMDHADYLMMRAPIPTLVCCATHDYFDQTGTWSSFRYASRLYARLGFAERMAIFENDDKHGWKKPIREAAARWMLRWLANRYAPITEPDIAVLTDEEIQCSPQGQVMLLSGARSVWDLNRDENLRLAEVRRKLWAPSPSPDLLDRVREIAGVRRFADLPAPEVKEAGKQSRENADIRKIVILPAENGVRQIHLPAVLGTNGKPTEVTIYLDDAGFAQAVQEDAFKQLKLGHAAFAVDVRGVGETRPLGKKSWYADRFGIDGREVTMAYLMGRSYVGMRTEDILGCVKWLRSQYGDALRVHLNAKGHLCTPALHAAALEPELFDRIHLERPLVSWSNVVETPITQAQPVNLVHGALRVYDLPELRRSLGNRLTIESPLDAVNQPVNQE